MGVMAGALLARYREFYCDPELPVSAESIAEDLLGLSMVEPELELFGMIRRPHSGARSSSSAA
jgi:hypothetical protein